MDNLNNISYEKNWKKASEPVRYKPPEQTIVEKRDDTNEKKHGKPLLTIIQIIICVLIVLTAYAFKAIGGDFYKTVKAAYEAEINNEIILNPFENDIDKLFNVSQK